MTEAMTVRDLIVYLAKHPDVGVSIGVDGASAKIRVSAGNRGVTRSFSLRSIECDEHDAVGAEIRSLIREFRHPGR